MRISPLLDLARAGHLYPGVIVHGASDALRREAALALGKTLLCSEAPELRPCGVCRHCRRIAIGEPSLFHPDFQVLERDLKTTTSVDAVKALLRGAQLSPFEARGQVFVIASAESLGGGGANALLKTLEEPPDASPRHFLLLTPSAVELLPTLRSRCLEVYLGSDGAVDRSSPDLASLVESLCDPLERYFAGAGAIYLQVMARQLESIGGRFEEVRDAAPWRRMANAVVALSVACPGQRRALLGLAEELLGAVELRLRGVPPARIIEGLLSRWLARSGSHQRLVS